MIQRARVQPYATGFKTPRPCDAPLQKFLPQSLADKFRHQPEVRDLDLVRLPRVELRITGRNARNVEYVNLNARMTNDGIKGFVVHFHPVAPTPGVADRRIQKPVKRQRRQLRAFDPGIFGHVNFQCRPFGHFQIRSGHTDAVGSKPSLITDLLPVFRPMPHHVEFRCDPVVPRRDEWPNFFYLDFDDTPDPVMRNVGIGIQIFCFMDRSVLVDHDCLTGKHVSFAKENVDHVDTHGGTLTQIGDRLRRTQIDKNQVPVVRHAHRTFGRQIGRSVVVDRGHET